MYYAIVTFGSPAPFRRQRWTKNLERAKRLAQTCKGSGSCTDARVLECESRALARTCDISLIREGERCIYMA